MACFRSASHALPRPSDALEGIMTLAAGVNESIRRRENQEKLKQITFMVQGVGNLASVPDRVGVVGSMPSL